MKIVVLSDGMKTFRFDTALLTFGRADDNLLQLDVPGVSRYHGKVEKQGSNYYIYDFGSTNGIYVNEEKVTDSLELHEGDIVRLHEVKLQFFELNESVKKSGIIFKEVVEDVQQLTLHDDPENLVDSNSKTKVFTNLEVDEIPVEGSKDLDVKDIAEYLKNNRIFQKNKSNNNSGKSINLKNSDTTDSKSKNNKSSNWIFYSIHKSHSNLSQCSFSFESNFLTLGTIEPANATVFS